MEEAPLSVFTYKELDLMKFAPSLYFALNYSHNTDLPIDPDNVRRETEVDIIGQHAVIESAVRGNYYNQTPWIFSKAKNLWRIADHSGAGNNIGIPTGVSGRTAHLLESGLDMPERWIRKLPKEFDSLTWAYQLKEFYSEALRKKKEFNDNRIHIKSRTETINFPALPELKDFFGEDIGVVLFGSATYGGEHKDYDVIVLVDEISEKMYSDMRGKEFKIGNKSLDTVVVRKSDWESFVICNSFSHGIVSNGMVVGGEVEFPKLDRKEAVYRSVSKAAKKLRTLKGLTLNLVANNPGSISSKPKLLNSLFKTPRFLYKAFLELKDFKENKPWKDYSKSEMEEGLQKLGDIRTRLADVNPSLSGQNSLVNRLYQTMIDSAEVVESCYQSIWDHPPIVNPWDINELRVEDENKMMEEIEKINAQKHARDFKRDLRESLETERRLQQEANLPETL